MALGLLAGLFASAPKALAAERSWGNVDLAKKVVENVAPIVSETIKPDTTAASLAVAADDFIQKPLVVETQITPEPPRVAARQVRQTTSNVQIIGQGEKVVGRRFPYGYCTYYVSQKREIPWSGNAITWLAGAKSFGYATGSEPKPGAIMVTSEGGRTGHVAYVEAVNGDQVTVSEMNYAGFGVISSRTISANAGVIRGYIY